MVSVTDSVGSSSGVAAASKPVRSAFAFALAIVFVLSLMIPVAVYVGPLQLMAHRAVLIVAFIPACILFVMGRAGKPMLVDWLLIFSAVWAVLALMVNHGLTDKIEAIGIHMVEFLGAYIVGRVAIRSARDFKMLVTLIVLSVIALAPFGLAEAVLKRAFILEAIPNSVATVNVPGRWGLRRAQTAFSHPIHWGVFASTAFALSFYIIRPMALKIVALPSVAIAAFSALSSVAILNVVIQCMLIAYDLITRKIKHRWRIFGAGCAAAYVFIDAASNRTPFHLLVDYATFNSGSAYNRILIWRYGTQNVRDNPLFGIGEQAWVRARWMSPSVDNYWLLMAMKYGMPAGLALFTAVIVIMWRTGRAPLTDKVDRACRAGFLAALGGLLIAGGTVHYWTAMMAFVMFLLGAGCWMFTGGAIDAESGVGPSPPDEGEKPASRYSRNLGATTRNREDALTQPTSEGRQQLPYTRRDLSTQRATRDKKTRDTGPDET